MEDNKQQIACHECRKWVHKQCATITSSEFEILSKGSSNLQWICDSCLECRGERVGILEAKTDLLTDAIMKITKKPAVIENARHLDSIKIVKKIKEVVDRKCAEDLGEKLEAEKRQ